jgi:hypothetical protein
MLQDYFTSCSRRSRPYPIVVFDSPIVKVEESTDGMQKLFALLELRQLYDKLMRRPDNKHHCVMYYEARVQRVEQMAVEVLGKL